MLWSGIANAPSVTRRLPEIADLKAKLDVAELKGKLDAVLALLGQKELKSAEVIDLPHWRKHNAA